MRLAAILVAVARVLAAGNPCSTCHPEHVTSYANTGMGRSVTKPSGEIVPHQQFDHRASGTRFLSIWRSGELRHKLVRRDQTSTYKVDWAVGSGNHGKSFLITVGDALFQSPISWYSDRSSWDVSPGFEKDPQPDFFRPVTADCLFCHAGMARPRPGTVNRYLDPPLDPPSIGCARCHGDPAAHLSQPRIGNIVNPSRLAPQRRDAVCEQCHLSGEARIPNPGKQFSDFRPGMLMEEVFSVYVNQAAGDPLGLKVVSHSEQLSRSRCFLESGEKMWCGSCHDPHRSPVDKASWYEQKCGQCHHTERTRLHRATAGGDCAGCHMPKLQAYDGGHTAFHDHWIRIKREQRAAVGSAGLRPWRSPPETLRTRNLGLAFISVGAGNGDAGALRKGLQLLGSKPADGAVETARGFVLMRSGNSRGAEQSFRRAVDLEPNDSSRRLNLASALFAAGDLSEAKRHAEQAIALEPLLEDAYHLLAAIEPKRAGYWKDRYRKLLPQRRLP